MWEYYNISSSVCIVQEFYYSNFRCLVIISMQISDELRMRLMILVTKVEIGKSNVQKKVFFSSTFQYFRRKNRHRRYIEHLTSSDSDSDEVSRIVIEYNL